MQADRMQTGCPTSRGRIRRGRRSRLLIRSVAAVALSVAGLAAVATPAVASSSVNASAYGVKCTGQTGSLAFSPPLTSSVMTGTETIHIAATLTGCTAAVPTGGKKITITKGVVTGTLTSHLDGVSGFETLLQLGGTVPQTGTMSVAWTTSPALISGSTHISVLSTGVGFASAGGGQDDIDLTIPGATKGVVTGSFSAHSVYSFDSSKSSKTVSSLLVSPSISSLALSGGLTVLNERPSTLKVTPSSSTDDPPYGPPFTTPYYAKATYGSSTMNVSQLATWSSTDPAVGLLEGVSFICGNQLSGQGDCENVHLGGLGAAKVTATLGTATASSTRTNVPDPEVATGTLPDAVSGVPYFWPITVTGGIRPYTVKSTSTLPDGFSVQDSPAGIVGTPTSPGTYTFYGVEVVDASGANAYAPAYTMTVLPAVEPLTVATTSLPGATVGSAYEQVLTPDGGSGDTPTPYAWTVTAGSLPDGLTLSASGLISGTPKADAVGTATFTAQVTDGSDPVQTATQSLTITVGAALAATPTVLSDATVDAPYAATLTAPTGGIGPDTYLIASGTLPGGLSLSTGGTISGTPTAANVGSTAFTVLVTDSSDPTQYVLLPESLTVIAPPPDQPSTTVLVLDPTTITSGQDVIFDVSVTGSGGVPSGTVTLTDGATVLDTCTLYQGATLSDCGINNAPTGTYPVTATYSGDTVFAGSFGTASLTVTP